MQKKKQSIWTADITPHVVNLFTMDITPDFSSDFWNQDITHHVVVAMAVFGLLVSACITTAGVTAAGVQVELAFAQKESVVSQTAALAMTDDHHAMGSTTPIEERHDRPSMGSTTPILASTTAMFCPKISRTIMRGNHEATTTGSIGQLQEFMAEHFNLDKKDVVTGFFGSTTGALLMKFQQEQGIAQAPQAGPLTRAAIARLCNPSSHDPMTTKGDVMRNEHMGSSTMGSTTEHHELPKPPRPPVAPTSAPVSYHEQSSNAASIIEALAEISDGYTKLLGAALGLVGMQ